MQKSRGSAILIAVFLIAAVGSVAFGIGRLFMMESAIANLYESSTVAYYAAESGIEEGFLRYRYDKNTIVPVKNGLNYVVSKNNLEDSTQTDQTQVQFNSFNPVANLRYYFLSMDYKQPFYGADMDGDDSVGPSDVSSASYPLEYSVVRDEAIKIDVTDVKSNDFKFITTLYPPSHTSVFFEAKLIGDTPLGLKELKIALAPDSIASDTGRFPSGSVLALSPATGFIETYYLDNLITKIRNTTSMSGFSPIFDSSPDKKVELYLKPICQVDDTTLYSPDGCKVNIGLALYNSIDVISGPYSTVKSIGMYGGVTRTLEAKIDRQAGTVYDLFDYVLYKKP